MNRGIIYALSAYIFWGVHPIYWKQLQHVSSFEIVSHRILWSLIFFIVIISLRGELKGLSAKVKSCSQKWILFLPAILIGSNWAIYIWAVNAGFIIETSLGYFICPLISVLLGVIFLGEKLKTLQWSAVIIAAAGVLYMTFIYGQFPWISLYLAGTWGTYGLLRKKSPLNSVEGLTLETFVLVVPVLFYLAYLSANGQAFFFANLKTTALMIGSGITSGLPLVVFIAGARIVNLSLIGIMQYVYPTIIFVIGAFVYNEPLSETKLIGFVFVWVALILYSIEGLKVLKRKRKRRSIYEKNLS